ncbi:MAG: glycoside hydrolase family 57 protein [Bacteroidales bacterium]|nr:glycoside hydrolase family 57 protein [Bacteroidales bacterium]
MKNICLYFQVHQPFRLRNYRFFEIGNNHYYYDDYANESIMRKIAENCYLPTNKILLDLIKEHGSKFKITFSISGIALDQFEMYAPDVIESFKKLANTGCVEFLAETNSHSLVSLTNKEEFIEQVKIQSKKVQSLFGQKPKVFRNTELIYSDEIGKTIAEMGFQAVLTEGAKHVLGWKSPNYLYSNAINPKLKVLLKNFKLSDDIAFRFSDQSWNEWPLTTEKFVGWINDLEENEEIINLFMDYETFGEHQKHETGILEFLKSFPKAILSRPDFSFITPTEAAKNLQPVSAINIPHPISWADEERDITAWLGNDLQDEAFNKLYELKDKVKLSKDKKIKKDWEYLQISDHFYYMCTKFFSDGAVHSYFNPYNSPYDAFINYMNVLSDFAIRLSDSMSEKQVELFRLKNLISKKDKQITKYKSEIDKLEIKLEENLDKKISTKTILKPKTIGSSTSKTTKTKKTVKKTVKKAGSPKTVKKIKPKAVKK